MRRYRLLCALGLALLVLYAMRGSGQAPSPSPRALIDQIAPPAIERGISPVEMRSPDNVEVRRYPQTASFVADRTGLSGADYVPGRVIVKFRDGRSTPSRLSTVRTVSAAASLSSRPDYANFDIVAIDPHDDAEAVARAFNARPDVEYAQAAYRVRARFTPNDRFYPRQWNLPHIDMERAWDIQPSAGSAITVAVIDTGVAYTNVTVRFRAGSFRDDRGVLYPALGELMLSFVAATELGASTRFVSPRDFIWNDTLPLDLDGHGTHVSGTIGQLTNNAASGGGDTGNGGGTAGVAFNVKLMPVKVIDADWDNIFGSPNSGTDDVVARGIRYAADNGAQILNMSIGRTGPPAPAVEDAIKYAVGKGCFVVIAAGNEFERGNPIEVIAEIASRVNGAVSVAATDLNKAHAFYSSSGSWVELAAPGGSFRGFDAAGGILQQTLNLDLVETFNLPPARYTAPRFDTLAYFFFTGTSQAAPHVTGVAAILMQQGITDPATIEAALERFATDLGDPGRDSLFGFGLVNARNTLRGLGLAK